MNLYYDVIIGVSVINNVRKLHQLGSKEIGATVIIFTGMKGG